MNYSIKVEISINVLNIKLLDKNNINIVYIDKSKISKFSLFITYLKNKKKLVECKLY